MFEKKLVVSSCCFAECSKEMKKTLSLTCRNIAFHVKLVANFDEVLVAVPYAPLFWVTRSIF